MSVKSDNGNNEEKGMLLYRNQKQLLDTFLERGAISKAQYDKSLQGLKEKMGIENILSQAEEEQN